MYIISLFYLARLGSQKVNESEGPCKISACVDRFERVLEEWRRRPTGKGGQPGIRRGIIGVHPGSTIHRAAAFEILFFALGAGRSCVSVSFRCLFGSFPFGFHVF